MLTDIFSVRYAERPLWKSVGNNEKALLIQGYRILSEQIIPPKSGDKDNAQNIKSWDSLEKRISMELGIEELSPHVYGYSDSNKVWQSGVWPAYWVCRTWMLAELKDADPDKFMKERISLVELAFRDQFSVVYWANQQRAADKAKFEKKAAVSHTEMLMEQIGSSTNARLNDAYNANCAELNERFRRAHAPLHYHNGFIQVTSDERLETHVVQPFWKLVADKKWENVSVDMAEAVDRRDTGGRDPGLYAAKALESVIKIVSDEKGWTTGNEKGAANYIDNLVSQNNGRFIAVWEAESMKHFFSKVRNQLGHGPGGEPMPELSPQQTNWAIETSMSWCKSLIERA